MQRAVSQVCITIEKKPRKSYESLVKRLANKLLDWILYIHCSKKNSYHICGLSVVCILEKTDLVIKQTRRYQVFSIHPLLWGFSLQFWSVKGAKTLINYSSEAHWFTPTLVNNWLLMLGFCHYHVAIWCLIPWVSSPTNSGKFISM